MLLSLIIPAFNEEARLEKSLIDAINYLHQQDYESEILVVDDGSTDGTTAVASKFSQVKLLVQPKNQGKGAAVRRGMLESNGDIRLFSDADFSTPIYESEKIIRSLANGADISIGSRAVDHSLIKEHQPFYREFMGKTFNKIVQALVIPGILDTQCGFKAFKSKPAIEVFSKSKINGFGFDVEALYLGSKFGYKIDEIPVEWYNDKRSRVHPIRDSWKMLLEIMKIKRLHRV